MTAVADLTPARHTPCERKGLDLRF